MGKLIARVAVGGLFAGHGMQKLFGWFDGPGLQNASGMMEGLGLRPGRRNAVAAAGTETVGGLMLMLGALTPVASAALIGTMITAVRTVHLKNGPWNQNGGWEYNAALIAALVAIVDGGPGRLSYDARHGLHETGPLWALGALGVGAAASTYVIAQGESHPAPPAAAVPGSDAGSGEPARETEPGVAR